jgi:acetyl-CoA carboxylase biotin carboxyl carrier protein
VNLSNNDVRDIVRLIDGLPFDELELETDRFRLVLHRGADGAWTRQATVLSPPDIEELPAGIAPIAQPAADGGASPVDADDGLHEVRAPLVGTFYRAPRPGAPPFVEVGTYVQPDTVVGLIETMKLFNAVEAGSQGEIVEIGVANGAFAEQGAVLMRVAPGTS